METKVTAELQVVVLSTSVKRCLTEELGIEQELRQEGMVHVDIWKKNFPAEE